MKYKVRGYQKRYVSEDIFEADNEQEATNLAFNSHYKGGLMLKVYLIRFRRFNYV